MFSMMRLGRRAKVLPRCADRAELAGAEGVEKAVISREVKLTLSPVQALNNVPAW